MVFGLLIVASGMAIMLITENIYVVTAGLALIGMGIAACDTPSMPLLTLLVPPERFGRAMALQDSAVNVGFLLGPILAITVGEHKDNFKWLCIAMAGACVAVTPWMKILYEYELRAEEIEEKKKRRGEREKEEDSKEGSEWRGSHSANDVTG